MLHIPPNTSTLESVSKQQIRLLIQSVYGQGKTFSAMSAPNPCVLNIDNNLGAHSGRKDIINVPFFDKKFVTRYNAQGLIHLAIQKWLLDEGSKLTEEQTAVIDGLTNLQNAYDREVSVPMSTKTGREDLMAWWGMKLEWQKEFFESLKQLKCDVIVTCHEQPERDNDGGMTNKVLPLVQGSFRDQIGTHFTDIVRQIAVSKPTESELPKVNLSNFGMKSLEEYKAFVNTFENNTIYLWQMCPDSIVSCKTHLKNCPKFVRANWNIFK